jgi:hypothetical protein
MPVMPLVGDRQDQLEAVVLATRDHGGSFVLGGGLSMDGVQAERTLEAARRFDPALEQSLRRMYGWRPEGVPRHGPPRAYAAQLGRTVRELCVKHGLLDRMPRYIPPGPLAINKRLAEQLFLKTYELELDQAAPARVWAYRKAAWAVDEHSESVGDRFEREGISGLAALTGSGSEPGRFASAWLEAAYSAERAARPAD